MIKHSSTNHIHLSSKLMDDKDDIMSGEVSVGN